MKMKSKKLFIDAINERPIPKLPKRYFVGLIRQFLSKGGKLPKGWKIVIPAITEVTK